MRDLPVKLEARLRAIEYLVVNLYGVENRRRGWDAERVAQEHLNIREKMRNTTAAVTDPAASDMMIGEIQDAVERLLKEIREVT